MLEGDARFRKPDPMDWADDMAAAGSAEAGEPTLLQRLTPAWWLRLRAGWRAVSQMSENARRLAAIVDTVDRDGTLKRLERAARILDNQQDTQRRLVDQVHNIERGMLEVAKQIEASRTAQLPAYETDRPSQLQIGVSG